MNEKSKKITYEVLSKIEDIFISYNLNQEDLRDVHLNVIINLLISFLFNSKTEKFEDMVNILSQVFYIVMKETDACLSKNKNDLN